MRILLGGDTLNLNQRSVGARVALSALVAKDAAFGVQSASRNQSDIILLSAQPEKLEMQWAARRFVGSRILLMGAIVIRSPSKPSTHFHSLSPHKIPPTASPAPQKRITHLVEPILCLEECRRR